MGSNDIYVFKPSFGKEFKLEIIDGKPQCRSCGVDINCRHRYLAVCDDGNNIHETLVKEHGEFSEKVTAQIKAEWEGQNIFKRFFK